MSIHKIPFPLVALCLISCSSSQPDDPLNPPAPNPDLVSIDFGGNSGTWQDAPSSRATNNGLESLFKSFRVWSYKTTDNNSQTVMDGYTINHTENTAGSTTSNTDDWEYVGIKNLSNTTQTIKYWDYSASDYRFFAYAPADANITKDDNSFSIPYTYESKTTTDTTPYVSDLWYSDNKTTNTKYGQCVTLTFAPVIAKVRFKFSYPESSTGVTIQNIEFRDSRLANNSLWAETPIKGNIKATYSATESTPPTFSWETSQETDATGTIIFNTPETWYYVPPLGNSSFEQGSYTITANIDGNKTSATVPAAYMQWKAGYQYTYIFKITQAGTGITFTDLQVEQWVQGANIDNNGNGTTGW